VLPEEKALIGAKESYAKCFGCGIENPTGLNLTFRSQGGTVKAEFTPGEFHQGWQGIVHGGLIYVLLDEAMGYATYYHGWACVTGKVEVRFRRPAVIGQPLCITGAIAKKTRKLIQAVATVTEEDGTVIAESNAIMYILNDKEQRHLASLAKDEG